MGPWRAQRRQAQSGPAMDEAEEAGTVPAWEEDEAAWAVVDMEEAMVGSASAHIDAHTAISNSYCCGGGQDI